MTSKNRRGDAAVLAEAEQAVRDLILAVEHYRIAATDRLGVTTSESQALSYLTARGPMGLTDLADALALSTGSATAMMDRLERNGLARRTPHPTDRRRVLVELTERGTRTVDQARAWLREAIIESLDDPRFDAGLISHLAAALARQAALLPVRTLDVPTSR